MLIVYRAPPLINTHVHHPAKNAGSAYVIKGRPKGVGVELKTLIDLDSSIILCLELCRGALRQTSKEYEKHGTAVMLRMTAPWHGKAHTVIADSAFSSVKSAVALKQSSTYSYFIGIVKTAHSQRNLWQLIYCSQH